MILSDTRTTKSKAIYKIICTIAFAYFCALVLFEIHQTAFYYDSGIHIDAAKMFAYGLGKPITPYTYELFSTLTSGPTIVWFGAFIVRLFGNSIWTAGFAAASLNLTLLAVLLWRLYKIVGNSCLPVFFCLSLIFLLLGPQWWVIFIGDISSLLLFLITATIAIDPNISENKRHTYSAITATLSLHARLISLPLIAGLVVYLLARQILLILNKESTPKKCIQLFLLSIFYYIIITLIFISVEYSFFLLSSEFSYEDFLHDRFGFLSGNSTLGVGALILSPDPFGQVMLNISSNFKLLAKTLDETMGLKFTLGLVFASILLPVFRSIRQRNALDSFIISLLPGLILISIWYFSLATIVFDRYTMQISFMILSMILLCTYSFFSWAGVVFLAAAILISQPDFKKNQLINTMTFKEKSDIETLSSQKNNKELEAAAHYIENNKTNYPLAKCGWMSSSWAIHYLLPPEFIFSDCYTIIRESLEFDAKFNPKKNQELTLASPQTPLNEEEFLASNKALLVRYKWISPVNFTLVIHKSSWQFSKFNKNARSAQKHLQDACRPATLFNNDSVRVMDCTFDNLQKNIPTDQFGFFVDSTPYWKR